MRTLATYRRRFLASLLLSGLLVPCAGCQVLYNVKRSVLTEPKRFSTRENIRLVRVRNACLAHRAWREVRALDDGMPASEHYAAGFRRGFGEYLLYGGDGQPPLVPPREYWNIDFETPNGKRAVDDWFAGYRHGVWECQARGHRHKATVHTSVFSNGSTDYFPDAGHAEPEDQIELGSQLVPTKKKDLPPDNPEEIRVPIIAPAIIQTSHAVTVKDAGKRLHKTTSHHGSIRNQRIYRLP